jgi:predicted PurR-regulated permease PerM
MADTPSIPPLPRERYTLSDKLAIALTCLAALLALVLFWIDKTPLSAGITMALMAALIAYPVFHFITSRRIAVVVLCIAWAGIGLFGWKVWPHPLTVTVAAPQTPLPNTINQTATDSTCSNFAAGSNAQIKCIAEERARHANDQPHH